MKIKKWKLNKQNEKDSKQQKSWQVEKEKREIKYTQKPTLLVYCWSEEAGAG